MNKLVFMIINGRDIAGKMYEDLKTQIEQSNSTLKLVAILVGDNSASLRYIAQKRKWAEYVGIAFELKQFGSDITQDELLTHIDELNSDSTTTGYIIQLPLPGHIDPTTMINAIDPKKDVDGFHPENQGKIMIGDDSGLVCCTPAGVMDILFHLGFDPVGKIVTVVGKSNIVGKPVANLLINAGATVISCDSKTPDIGLYTDTSDLIIMAAGVPGLLKSDMVSDKAIVIDVGFTIVGGKVFGDADFDNIEPKVRAITPVPGGVGALTVANLMRNVVKASQ